MEVTVNADEKAEELFLLYWRGRSGQSLPVGRDGVILKINKSKFCVVCKWILTYDAIYLWRQPLIYSVTLFVTTVQVSQTLQRTVAGLTYKRTGKHIKKVHSLSGGTILIFSWAHWVNI